MLPIFSGGASGSLDTLAVKDEVFEVLFSRYLGCVVIFRLGVAPPCECPQGGDAR